MSIKTTHVCTREFAISVINSKLWTMNNDQLANALEETIHNGFYNFAIVDKDELENYKQKDYPVLNDLNDIPEFNDVW